MANALEIRSLTKNFGSVRALDGVDLDLRAGETLGLLGPNGAGKSTLVRAIMGRVRPDAGSMTLFGTPMTSGSADQRGGIGFVPQEIALYPLLTAAENLQVFGRYLGLKGEHLRKAIDHALEWSSLKERARSRTKDLSGGMKRRLNMAAGILHQPRVLLLDEPTVGVDPQSRERIYEMIGAVRAAGASVIYTTHYMEEAERLCDRVAVIDRGRIIAVGPKEQLVNATIGPAREIVVECSTDVSESVRRLVSRFAPTISGSRIRIRTERPADDIPALLEALESEKQSIRDLRLEAPTLERVFIHLTGRELRE